MEISSKQLRKYNYFVLYDMDDYPICLFENLEELLQHINYNCSKLVYQFKKFGNSINIVIGNKIYKLFRFED